MDYYAAATRIVLEDPGVEKLRWLCWAVAGVQRLPFGWTYDPQLLVDGTPCPGAILEARIAPIARASKWGRR